MTFRVIASVVYIVFILVIYFLLGLFWRWFTNRPEIKDITFQDYWKFRSIKMWFKDAKDYTEKEKILTKYYGRAAARFGGALDLLGMFAILLFGGIAAIWWILS
jgi:hypothetical protein